MQPVRVPRGLQTKEVGKMKEDKKEGKKEGKFIEAHHLAQWEYCPEAYRLEQLGHKPNAEAQAQRDEGVREHERWQLRADLRFGRLPRRRPKRKRPTIWRLLRWLLGWRG